MLVSQKRSSVKRLMPFTAHLAVRNGGIIVEAGSMAELRRKIGEWLIRRDPDEDAPGDFESNLRVFAAVKRPQHASSAYYQ